MPAPFPFRLETPRLVLREWRDADREHCWRMAQDSEVMRHLPVLDRTGSDAMVDRMMAMQEAHGHTFWAVEGKEDGCFHGMCGMSPPRDPLVEPEIGWRLARHAWGQGYALEAARATLDWAWAHRDMDTVVAITVPANERSRRLMERLGMSHDPGEDFDHPSLPEGDPLRRHVLYRIHRPR